jgi:hypothetical protein
MRRRRQDDTGKKVWWLPDELWQCIFDALLEVELWPHHYDGEKTHQRRHEQQLVHFMRCRVVCVGWLARTRLMRTLAWPTMRHFATHCNSKQLLTVFAGVQQFDWAPEPNERNAVARIANVTAFCEQLSGLRALYYAEHNVPRGRMYDSVPQFTQMTALRSLWYVGSHGVLNGATRLMPPHLTELCAERCGSLWLDINLRQCTALRSLSLFGSERGNDSDTYSRLTSLRHLELCQWPSDFTTDIGSAGATAQSLHKLSGLFAGLTHLTLSLPKSFCRLPGGDQQALRRLIEQVLYATPGRQRCDILLLDWEPRRPLKPFPLLRRCPTTGADLLAIDEH